MDGVSGTISDVCAAALITGEKMGINKERKKQEQPEPAKAPHRITLPGWILKEEEIGLGEALKRAFYRAGIKPCPGCQQRAAALNRRFVLSRRSK